MPEPAPSALRPSVTAATPVAALAAAVGARLLGDDAAVRGVVVHGVEQRSNAVQAGDLFAALPGAKAHGATFASAAVQAGAVAVLTDEDGADIARALGVPILLHPAPRAVLGEISATVYGHPSRHMQVIGVTGTSGKTTTSYLIEAALEAAGRKPGLIGTIETRIHGQRIPSALTTPEAPQLHALFAAMREQGADCVVMEVSSHALALGRVDGIRFDVGAFTNLSQDHLDFHPHPRRLLRRQGPPVRPRLGGARRQRRDLRGRRVGPANGRPHRRSRHHGRDDHRQPTGPQPTSWPAKTVARSS